MPLFENTRIQIDRGEVLHGGADPPDEEYERTEQNFIPPSGSREQADASFGILGAEQRRPIRMRAPSDPEMTARLRPYAIRRADANLLAAHIRIGLDDFLRTRTSTIAGMLAEGATDDLESFVNRETEMLETLRRMGPSSNRGSGVTGGADAPDADAEEEFRDRHLYEMSTPQLRRTLGMTRAALAEANTQEFEEEAAALTRLIAILEELIRRRDELENYYGIVGSGPDDDDDEPSAKRPAVSNESKEEIRRRIDALPYAGPMYGRRPISEEQMARMRSARAAFPDEDVARIIANEKGRVPEPGPVRNPLSVPYRAFSGTVYPRDERRGDDYLLSETQRQLPNMTTNEVRERLRILRLHRDLQNRRETSSQEGITSVLGRPAGEQEFLNEAIALTEEELRGRGLRGGAKKSIASETRRKYRRTPLPRLREILQFETEARDRVLHELSDGGDESDSDEYDTLNFVDDLNEKVSTLMDMVRQREQRDQVTGNGSGKKLTKRQLMALARHSGQHTEKHMDEMIKLMLGGVRFRDAHRRANKSVGK